MDETSEFYAKYIFKLLNFDVDDEIPTDEFKKAIFYGEPETREILSMFCCADMMTFDNDEDYKDDERFASIHESADSDQEKHI
mmetsp:Transcript_24260/g.23867  ORF Transcript_24260/g.23867 Transcript_24260/m.23867 type:complete len:83 (+) Transcript_24260:906-1154(+)